MKRDEFLCQAMELLSKLLPKQRQRLLDQLEAHLWMTNHLRIWDEKRTCPPHRMATRNWAGSQKTIRSNLNLNSPQTGLFLMV